MQAGTLMVVYILTTVALQGIGFLISRFIEYQFPLAGLTTFLILFMMAFGLAWPIAVRIAEWGLAKITGPVWKKFPSSHFNAIRQRRVSTATIPKPGALLRKTTGARLPVKIPLGSSRASASRHPTIIRPTIASTRMTIVVPMTVATWRMPSAAMAEIEVPRPSAPMAMRSPQVETWPSAVFTG